MLDYKTISVVDGKPVSIPQYKGFDVVVPVQVFTPFKVDELTIVEVIQDLYAELEYPKSGRTQLAETWMIAHTTLGDCYSNTIKIPYWLAEWAYYNEYDLPVTFSGPVALTANPIRVRVKSEVYNAMVSMFRTEESLSLLAKSKCRTLSLLPALMLIDAIPDWFGKKLNESERNVVEIYKDRLADIKLSLSGKEQTEPDRMVSCYAPQWLSIRAAHSRAFELSNDISAISALFQAVCNDSLNLK